MFYSQQRGASRSARRLPAFCRTPCGGPLVVALPATLQQADGQAKAIRRTEHDDIQPARRDDVLFALLPTFGRTRSTDDHALTGFARCAGLDPVDRIDPKQLIGIAQKVL